MPQSIVAQPSGRIIARDLRWARSFRDRSKGLIGSPPLAEGQAFIIEPGMQVHTFRMRYPIDVVFCDRNWVVKHLVRSMQPNRMSRLVVGAHYIVEMPAGAVGESLGRGDQLQLRE